ncbi:MAG TPA: hypothetical protein VN645_09700 [Steroidobacteraceae bacterium]|nr:hypothetical protein [Steroidobacteraceae bacterium]
MSQTFSFPRFRRVLQNDVLRILRPLMFGTLAMLGLVCVAYLINFEPGRNADQSEIGQVFFGLMLGLVGLLFTSSSFNDMHHPLERYHFLMLPVSNFERFLSRYVLTGPLLLLYVVAAFTVMDWTANHFASWAKEASVPLFSPFAPVPVLLMKIYLLLHTVMLTGAICFRSYAWMKTALSFLLVLASMPVVVYVSLRIFYYDSFSWSSFKEVGAVKAQLVPVFEAHWLNVTVVVGFALWILYVAYRCLRAHEVQE